MHSNNSAFEIEIYMDKNIEPAELANLIHWRTGCATGVSGQRHRFGAARSSCRKLSRNSHIRYTFRGYSGFLS